MKIIWNAPEDTPTIQGWPYDLWSRELYSRYFTCEREVKSRTFLWLTSLIYRLLAITVTRGTHKTCLWQSQTFKLFTLEIYKLQLSSLPQNINKNTNLTGHRDSRLLFFTTLNSDTHYSLLAWLNFHLPLSDKMYQVEAEEQEQEHCGYGGGQACGIFEREDMNGGARFFPGVCSIVKVHRTAVVWKKAMFGQSVNGFP